MKRYFVTGTDTDCGKTYVTCQLLKYFQSKQYQAQAIKPVASGCSVIDGDVINEDVRLLQAHNSDASLIINRWRYKLPVSPNFAAKDASETITLKEMTAFCEHREFNAFDPLLIEGAGGLMVPFNARETWVDFLKCTQIPVILVVGMRLGCINHASLTVEVLQAKGIVCTGWIANCIDPNKLFLNENIAFLQENLSIPLIGVVPFQSPIEITPHFMEKV